MTSATPFSAALLLLASPAIGQVVPQPRHLGAIEACQSIGADAARLACFDREAAALVAASRSGELSLVDRADMRTARRSLFGFALPKLPFFAGDKSADESPDQLDTTIRSVQAIAGDRYRITVNDGNAVWETTESPMHFDEPRSGEKIVIKKGALGAYFLRVGGRLGVKGRRVS